MKTIKEWLSEKGVNDEFSSGDYGMQVQQDDGLLESQVEQLVTRLEGLCHGLPGDKKTAVVDKFLKQVEERILGRN